MFWALRGLGMCWLGGWSGDALGIFWAGMAWAVFGHGVDWARPDHLLGCIWHWLGWAWAMAVTVWAWHGLFWACSEVG
jgi:hypothetical protein